ncbi:T9SS type A sorting domain-containing protein, partial [candidate division WOR-3 bacterium]|nr:T9SS type A sorting domain-containing protein [candidate division WOR-3 bacterium]
TWETDVQLTFTSDGSYEPQVSSDINNCVYVTWYDYRCGTGQEEVYVKWSLPTGVEETLSDISNKLFISAYPNPFREWVEIRLKIPEVRRQNSEVRKQMSLKIYNVSGRLIKSFQLPTAYSLLPTVFKWDGRDNDGKNVTSGVYFLKFKAINYQETKQLLLLR